jgi:hypothetical protein
LPCRALSQAAVELGLCFLPLLLRRESHFPKLSLLIPCR